MGDRQWMTLERWHVQQVALTIDNKYKLHYGLDPIEMAIDNVARRFEYDFVVEYLLGLPPWDGVKRLESWMTDFLFAPSDTATRAVSRTLPVALVARALEPGVKWDQMVILEGEQGIGKSTAWSTLAGGEPGFSDEVLGRLDSGFGDRSVESKLVQNGCWLHENQELAGIRSSHIEHLKAMLSKREDVFRSAYERRALRHPRRFIMVGSTNETELGYLPYDEQHRRFWPVPVGVGLSKRKGEMLDITGLREARDMIFAEAMVLWKSEGEQALLVGAQEAAALMDRADTRTHRTGLVDLVWQRIEKLECFRTRELALLLMESDPVVRGVCLRGISGDTGVLHKAIQQAAKLRGMEYHLVKLREEGAIKRVRCWATPKEWGEYKGDRGRMLEKASNELRFSVLGGWSTDK